jgi:hypothetical protein
MRCPIRFPSFSSIGGKRLFPLTRVGFDIQPQVSNQEIERRSDLAFDPDPPPLVADPGEQIGDSSTCLFTAILSGITKFKGMTRLTFKEHLHFVPKLAALWTTPIALAFVERFLLRSRTYYSLFVGLALIFVLYGLTIRFVFSFLQQIHREPFYVWIGYLVWSVLLCGILAVFALEYDLLPHVADSLQKRPLIDYLYYEVVTFTTVGYGDIVPVTTPAKILAMCTALLGATHGVTFVAIVLQALTQHPSGKRQE